MPDYFCGWYFRCQSNTETVAVIPSVHKIKTDKFCTIQLITREISCKASWSISCFSRKKDEIRIGQNRFGPEGISLNIHTGDLYAEGSLVFGPFTPLRYDIMGPFRYVPFLQCRHSVYSMHHPVNGILTINGSEYVFKDGVGYTEGDRGYSFPGKYVWTQGSFPGGALMLSIADIPITLCHFTGVIGIVYLDGKEYRLATYLGARAKRIDETEILILQGKLVLKITKEASSGYPLRAPVRGLMCRTIYEHPSCKIHCYFEINGIPMLNTDIPNAAFEYEY